MEILTGNSRGCSGCPFGVCLKHGKENCIIRALSHLPANNTDVWGEKERFEPDYELYYECPRCGFEQYYKTKYCPECGAKLDGKRYANLAMQMIGREEVEDD